MAAPGLLPEGDPRPLPIKSFVLVALLAAAAGISFVYGLWMRAELREVREERDAVQAELASLKPLAARARALELELEKARLLEHEAREAARRPDPPPPEPAPEPPAPPVPPPPADPARLESGKEAFRAGRFAESQVHFFRALPEGYVYLALSSLARGDVEDALAYLTQAMEADPGWLSLLPRSLFGSEEDYLRVLEEAQARVSEDPLDARAKLLLAYLHYHEKGAPFAKALLTEVTTADPDHEAARRFLETLEK